jgi:hypothetical protein
MNYLGSWLFVRFVCAFAVLSLGFFMSQVVVTHRFHFLFEILGSPESSIGDSLMPDAIVRDKNTIV